MLCCDTAYILMVQHAVKLHAVRSRIEAAGLGYPEPGGVCEEHTISPVQHEPACIRIISACVSQVFSRRMHTDLCKGDRSLTLPIQSFQGQTRVGSSLPAHQSSVGLQEAQAMFPTAHKLTR